MLAAQKKLNQPHINIPTCWEPCHGSITELGKENAMVTGGFQAADPWGRVSSVGEARRCWLTPLGRAAGSVSWSQHEVALRNRAYLGKKKK